jgi:hypothetical protein
MHLVIASVISRSTDVAYIEYQIACYTYIDAAKALLKYIVTRCDYFLGVFEDNGEYVSQYEIDFVVNRINNCTSLDEAKNVLYNFISEYDGQWNDEYMFDLYITELVKIAETETELAKL